MGTVFELYRYQLLPIDRYLQGDLVSGITTIEQLLERKNEFLQQALAQTNEFSSPRTETITKRLHATSDFILYRIAANRSIHRETREFEDEYLDNWPSVLVAIWNDPEVQMLAIQKRTTAFQQSKAVASLIFETVEPYLEKHHLRAHIEPLFEVQEFWDMIAQYEGRVQELEFEFLTPNMANISGTLPDNLKEFAKVMNSATNKLSIASDEEAALHVDQSNETVNGLVDYSAQGGGNISVRIAGIRKRQQTSRTVKEVELEDMHMEGSAAEISAALKDLMK